MALHYAKLAVKKFPGFISKNAEEPTIREQSIKNVLLHY